MTSLAAIVTIYIANQQLSIDNQRLRSELESPRICYTVTDLSQPLPGAAEETYTRLYNEFFAEACSYLASYPQADYLEAAASVSPLSATLTTQIKPAVSVELLSAGEREARQIRIEVQTDSSLVEDFQVDTHERYSTEGGKGETRVLFEIERLVPADTVPITVTFEPTSRSTIIYTLSWIGPGYKFFTETVPPTRFFEYLFKEELTFEDEWLSLIGEPMYVPHSYRSPLILLTDERRVAQHELEIRVTFSGADGKGGTGERVELLEQCKRR